MDEEQGLASPLAGGISAVRRTVSSSVFGGRQAPVQAQPDPQTTNLLQQNSLALNNVSAQLTNISQQVSGLNGSLAAIQENLAVSDTLERQREAAKQNREAILAEQGLREGKESQIESRIQQALTFPVRRLAQKTQFGLSRLTNFFLILAGGWLTNTLVDMIQASADGNTDLLKQLQNKLQQQLLVVGGTMVAVSLGFKAILNGVSALAASALRLGKGGLLSIPFRSIAFGLKTGALLLLNDKIVPKTGNPVVDFASNALALGSQLTLLNFLENKLFPQVGKEGAKTTTKTATKTVVKEGTKNVLKNVGGKGFMGLIRKLALPFKGKGGAIGSFLIDYLIFGEDLDKAIAGAVGFFAGAKAGAAIGAAIGALFGGVGAGPGALIGGFVGGFIGGEAMKSLLGGIKALFGFKTERDPNEELSFDDGSLQRVEEEDVVVGMKRGGIVRGPRINKDIVPALLTPGEFIMTRETTDRIGASFFEALNKGGMVDKSITPVNKMEANNVAEKVSSLEEGAAEIVTFPMAGQGGGADATSDGSGGEATNNVPNIGFNENNIHTLYASSMYGANA